MEPISIGALAHFDFLKAKLDWELGSLETDGLRVIIDETTVGDINFIGCNVADYGNWQYSEADITKIFRHHVANVVSDVIINQWEEELVQDIIRENYYYFTNDERKVIFENATRKLGGALESGEGALQKTGRKSKILQKLLDYLYANNQLVIDGFIKFRLKEYLGELAESVEKAVDDFVMEREYQEFIKLLKYFVDIQEPRIELVHITVNEEGAFRLKDKDYQAIEHEYLDGVADGQPDSEINHEDLLVSALITLAPKALVLHFDRQNQYAGTIRTLENVFVDRVTICPGCELCRN